METHTEKMKHTGIQDLTRDKQGEFGPDQDTHDQDQLKLERFLKLLGFSMAVFGMFHLDQFIVKKQSGANTRPKLLQLHSIYCYTVMVVFCGFFVRSILNFFFVQPTGPDFAFKIIVATWSLQITLNVFLMLKASHPRWGNQQLACQNWNAKVISLMDCLDFRLNVKQVQKLLLVVLVIGWVSVIFNCCLVPAIIFYNPSTFGDAVVGVLIGPLPTNKLSKIVFSVFVAYQTVAWIVPVIYKVALCVLVQSGYKVCTLALGSTIDSGKETNTYPTCLYRQRMLHLHITQCLDLIDKDLKYMYANMFFTNIPMACFILYEMLKTTMDSLTFTAFAFWLGTNILFVTVGTLAGALVNKAAHSPLDCLYEVGLTGISLEQLGQLHLFTSKLNGGAIGFTVMTFVPVTKELFLTVGGLYITYFFILLQF